MDSDATLRTGCRVLTIAAFLAFVVWLIVLQPVLLLLAIVLGVAAYALFFEDQRQNPVYVGAGAGRDTEDRVEEGSQVAVSPGVSAAGIHLTFETRSRWGRRR